MADQMLRDWLDSLPGGPALSRSFCNEPVRIDQSWVGEPVAAVILCGRDHGHEGECDPYPDPLLIDGTGAAL